MSCTNPRADLVFVHLLKLGCNAQMEVFSGLTHSVSTKWTSASVSCVAVAWLRVDMFGEKSGFKMASVPQDKELKSCDEVSNIRHTAASGVCVGRPACRRDVRWGERRMFSHPTTRES